MRVAVQNTNEDHPDREPFVYRIDGIADDLDPITGEVRHTARELAARLLEEAQSEFPKAAGYVHRIEHFVGDHWEAVKSVDAPAPEGAVTFGAQAPAVPPDDRIGTPVATAEDDNAAEEAK